MGLEDRDFTLYDNLEIEVNQGDTVYITGQSGSGKSVLLRELLKQMSDLNPICIDDVELLDKPLVDQVGATSKDAYKILSCAGLNDAQLFNARPCHLSDGQMYRLRIAKLMDSDSKIWFADEFGAVLDRTTAKAVAYNLRRQAQRVGATVVVATTHKDLKDELAPNLYIDKSYKAQIEIEYKGESIQAKPL